MLLYGQAEVGMGYQQEPTELCSNGKIEKIDPSYTFEHSINNINNSDTKNPQQEWTGVYHQIYQAKNIKNGYLLANKYTVTIFCNLEDMVTIVHHTNQEFLDLLTNTGVLRTMLQATILGWGKAYFNLHAITNIFSYVEMVKQQLPTI